MFCTKFVGGRKRKFILITTKMPHIPNSKVSYRFYGRGNPEDLVYIVNGMDFRFIVPERKWI